MSRLLRVVGPGCFVGLVRERAVADAVPDQPRWAQMMLDRHERLVGRRAEVTEEVGGSPGAGRRPRTRHQALQEEAEALALGILENDDGGGDWSVEPGRRQGLGFNSISSHHKR